MPTQFPYLNLFPRLREKVENVNIEIMSTTSKITPKPPSNNKRRDIAAVILTVIAVAGVLSIALIAPNAMRMFVPMSKQKGRKIYPWEIERALERLISGGLIERKIKKDGETISLTTLGQNRLRTINLQNARIRTPAKWDKKWRLVFFDIPHARGTQRDRIRKKLKELGFLQIQKSVYLHPYECYGIIQSLQDFYKIKSYCHYAVVEKIEGSKKYLRHFNLS